MYPILKGLHRTGQIRRPAPWSPPRGLARWRFPPSDRESRESLRPAGQGGKTSCPPGAIRWSEAYIMENAPWDSLLPGRRHRRLAWWLLFNLLKTRADRADGRGGDSLENAPEGFGIPLDLIPLPHLCLKSPEAGRCRHPGMRMDKNENFLRNKKTGAGFVAGLAPL